ncbi:hypothetical protein KHC28_02715 [Ancylobacter sonchi]|uniref:DUF6455 family protein n=1 Tax=Ancylobacter sonchi TaxID=1937790 RepID=UPI001BD4FBBD|nr:DUF6455 family protein [Ancylobacter sonchi]MBS7532568.1 hypothetical protein [Ancylobacter sonchi]
MRIDTIDERLALFLHMAGHMGLHELDPSAIPLGELRAGAQRCLGCRTGEACRDFLVRSAENAPPPEFCRNADTFRRWVEAAIEGAPRR